MQDGFRNTPTSSQRPECGYKEEVMQWPELWEGGGGGTRRREERSYCTERPFSVSAVPFRKQVSLCLYKTEAVHPSVRLTLIPFHLSDSP